MKPLDYWKEGISDAAQECGLFLTDEQLEILAKTVEGAHDNYGQAFYSPPDSDRVHEIEREHERQIKKLEAQLERERNNAHVAIKQALRVKSDENVSIGEYGEVTCYGGRIERIQ